MLYYSIVFAIFLANIVLAEDSSLIYPTYSFCNQKLISRIKEYWAANGTPLNVLKTFQEGKSYAASDTSFTYLNEEYRCLDMNVGKNTINITITPHEKAPSKSLLFNVREDDGNVIHGSPLDNSPSHEFKLYTVHACRDVVVNYICSEVKGSPQPPMTVFWVSKKRYDKSKTKNMLKNLRKVMEDFDFDMKYHYGSECFS